jgi:hypothetical protein
MAAPVLLPASRSARALNRRSGLPEEQPQQNLLDGVKRALLTRSSPARVVFHFKRVYPFRERHDTKR